MSNTKTTATITKSINLKTKDANKSTKVDTKGDDDSKIKKSKKYDSFFLEEAELADDDDVDIAALDPNNDRNWNPKSVNRKAFKRTSDKFANVDTSKLSKQELRLLKWQQDRRGKTKILLGKDNHQDRSNRDNSRDKNHRYNSDNSNTKVYKRDNHNDTNSFRQKPYTNSSNHKNRDNKNDRDNKNEGFKRKVEGSIVESRAKKIKFEE